MSGTTASTPVNPASSSTTPLCSMCDKAATNICNQCRCSRYCSKICQEDDWPVHKILCKSFAAISNENRPRPYLTRAIYFPTEGKKLEFFWMRIVYHKREFDERKDTMDIGISNLQPEDRGLKYVTVQWVEYNEVLERSHRRIELLGVLRPPGENGKGMLIGNSNTSTARIDKELTEQWKGPIVWHALNEDLDMTDFSHVVDYTRADYYAAHRAQEKFLVGVDGVRINCHGDIDITGRPELEPLTIPDDLWPPPEQQTLAIPIGENLGFPLRVGAFEPELPWRGRHIKDSVFTQEYNPQHMALNLTQWSFRSNSTVVVRKDEKPLHVAHVHALKLYCTALAHQWGNIKVPEDDGTGVDREVHDEMDPQFQAQASFILGKASKEEFLAFWKIFMEDGGQGEYGHVVSPYEV